MSTFRHHPGPSAHRGQSVGLVYDDPVPGGHPRLDGAELMWAVALPGPDGAIERGLLPFGHPRGALDVGNLDVDVSSDLGGGVTVKVDFVPRSGSAQSRIAALPKYPMLVYVLEVSNPKFRRILDLFSRNPVE
ncbi:Glyoxalase bleomycin resistance protein dioxygenase superfamily [Colletotrichum higginsianum IMI 349063]|uniref:Glyoxalase bleomycin resistance protein dioxygenase superfamily n=1 Tax=Colletotrichum higginsianum (strain IMI 349063) TaxID=759273 RepID=A0A1B7YG54_COLHI|nr:Glyoxalase bleomycin resistance protein dioxygenase superfamily [Colletotrichum higginsianum IMI 349063]OBR10864.1 Glyoxalase bleomycin resistance protein dioxygenase superfamily [Colletotrichum higginsianum IMI 349063]